jgi:hypothetical protein
MLSQADKDFDEIIDDLDGFKTTPTQFGPFVGEGSQNAASEAAKDAGVALPLLLFVDRCEFFAFADTAARAVFLEANRSRELIERVDGSRPYRPFIDVDDEREILTVDDAEAIGEAFTSVALEWGVPEELAAPVAVGGRRAGKFSIHLIADGWQVANGPTGRAFAEAVRDEVEATTRIRDRDSTYFDTKLFDVRVSGCSVKATLGLRLPWCPKLTGRRGKPIPGSILEPLGGAGGKAVPAEWGACAAPWCVQEATRDEPVFGPGAGSRRTLAAGVVSGDSSLEETVRSPLTTNRPGAAGVVSGDSSLEETVRSPLTTNRPGAAGLDIEAGDTLFARLVAAMAIPAASGVSLADIYHIRDRTGHEAGIVACFDRVQSGFCSACDRSHDSIGAYVSQDADGTLFLRCWNTTDKRGPALMTVQAPDARMREGAILAAAEAPADNYDDLTPGSFELVGEPKREGSPLSYNTEAIGDDGISDLYVASSWGTGKSQHNKAIVREAIRTRTTEITLRCLADQRKADGLTDRVTVLIISSRISLSKQLLNDLLDVGVDVVSYKDLKGQLDVTKHPISVFQIDSIKRVAVDLPPFDLIIIDELSQLNAHVYQVDTKTGQHPKVADMTTLKHHLRKARRLIVTDNDLTQAQVDALVALRPRAPRRVVRNQCQPWEGMPVKVFTGAYARERVAIRLRERVREMSEKRKRGQPWKACVVPCHSKTLAEGFYKEFSELYGPDKVKLYTSDEDDSKKADFEDATKAWAPEDPDARPLVIIYSGTVSVGVSCSSDSVDECFAFFKDKNAAAPQSAQMMFRCRKLKRATVAYSGQQWAAGSQLPPQTLRELCSWATAAKNRGSIPDPFRHDRNAAMPDAAGETATRPEDLEAFVAGSFEGRMWVANELEKHRSAVNFVPRLVRILERAGIAVEVVDGKTTEAKKETQEQGLKGVKTQLGWGMDDVRTERSAVAAEHLETAVAIRRDQAEQGIESKDDNTPRTKGEKLGLALEHATTVFGVDPAEITASPDAAGWFKYYENCVTGYRNLARAIRGESRKAFDYETASPYEATKLATEALEAVGLTLESRTGNNDRIALDKLQPATNPSITAAFDQINRNCLRLYQDRHGGRRAKSGPVKPRTVVSALNAALRFFDGAITPQYTTQRERARKTPSHYAITWPWETNIRPDPKTGECPPPPEPRPAHPM